MFNEITYWSNLNVIRPDEKGNFYPNRAVTRGEFAAYISRALNLPASTTHLFKDLKPTDPLTAEIQAAAASNIINGYPDGTFRPNDKITRQHMAALLQRALRYKNVPLDVAPLTFKDNEKINEQFKAAVATNVYYNIIRGVKKTDGTFFNPQDSTTIAHAAALLFRMNTTIEQYGVKEDNTVTEDGGTTEKPEPEQPAHTDVFYIGSIVNGVVKKNPTVYLTYEQAEKADNASSAATLILNGDKIIKMPNGIASAAETKANTVTIYADKDFKKSLTYVVKGSEFKYIDSNEQYTIVQVADTKGYIRTSEATLVPFGLMKEQNYYYVADGLLTHKTYDHHTQKYSGDYTVGEAPSFMKSGVHYYSPDGVNFYSDGLLTKKVGTYYPYFQFASVRQPSNYTAEELDALVMTLLEERKATGIARYENATTESRLIGIGTLLKEVEANHNINALFILATAMHEGDFGISPNSLTKNNIFGIKVFDSNTALGTVYESRDDSVMAFVNMYTNLNYVPQSGGYAKGAVPGNKTTGMNVHYASDPFWGSKISGHMFRMDNRLGKKDFGQHDLSMVLNNGESVNARAEASTTSEKMFTYKAKVIGETKKFGYPVVIVEETKAADGYTWYKILSDDNPPADYVWIRSDLITKIQSY